MDLSRIFFPLIAIIIFIAVVIFGDSAVLALHSIIYSNNVAPDNYDLQRRSPAHLIDPTTIEASIYSRYPFNFRHSVLVAAGSEEGARVDSAVLTPGGGFYGILTKVFEHYSIVTTLSDDDFSMPVRISTDTGEEDALLTGGVSPMLTLISSEAKISPGDLVYTAGPEAPYGTPIGSLISVYPSSDLLFQEGEISVGYDFANIKKVLIVDNPLSHEQ